jgi:hypothetical protein
VLKKTKAHAIEANQTLLRADPKIAVWGLGERIDGPSGESLLGAPVVS